jgi:hypothetical protein
MLIDAEQHGPVAHLLVGAIAGRRNGAHGLRQKGAKTISRLTPSPYTKSK